MAVWTTAFDASGQEGDDLVTVAGFVARADDWVDFDRAWRERLRRDGLTWYHHTDFPKGGEFREGWKDNPTRCRKLSEDLLEIIQRHAHYKFACCVPKVALQSQLILSDFRLTAYVLAGRSVVALANEWRLYPPMRLPEMSLQHVFAENDKGQGLLEKRLIKDGWSKPLFRPVRDVEKKDGLVRGFTPLQAADLFALEVHRWHRDKNYDRHPRLKELDKTVLGQSYTYTADDIAKLGDVLSDIEYWTRYADFL